MEAEPATSPATTAYVDGQPQLVDSFGNHYTGAAFAIHVALTQAPEQALQRTLTFNEQVFEKHPDRWGFVYNNAALAARGAHDYSCRSGRSGSRRR